MRRRALVLLAVVAALNTLSEVRADTVDDRRLLGARDDTRNWLTYGRDYTNQRFSPLTSIDRSNVAKLVPAWTFNSGVAGYQATPLVVDGVMYVSLAFNHVVALDARTGKQLWRYEHKRRTDKMCCGPANRGVAVAYGKVFIGTVDARLIALDQKTGKPVWDVALVEEVGATAEQTDQLSADDPRRKNKVSGTTGVGASMAPVAYRGKVIIGITGVGFGLHLEADREGAPLGAVVGFAGQSQRAGFYAAFDAATGARVWQFDSTPATGWEGEFRATTHEGDKLDRDLDHERAAAASYPDAARRGGGSAWTTPAVDPQTNTVFVGIGNPSPQMDDKTRPGDNLYTVSLVALDADSGKLKWYYQIVPHDLWGYDVASPAVLFDATVGSETVPAVGHAGKTGWFYVLDRRDGKLLYRSAEFVPHANMFKRPTPEGIDVAPGGAGGASWSPVAFDPNRGVAYVAALHWPMRYAVKEIPAQGEKPAIRYSSLEPTSGARWGTLSAIDTRNRGSIKWQVKTAEPLVGGVLATAGGLLFVGEGNGNFNSYDADTGAVLWQHQCGAGVNAPAITYELDGKQYVAVAAGGNQLFGFKQGDAVRVFALP